MAGPISMTIEENWILKPATTQSMIDERVARLGLTIKYARDGIKKEDIEPKATMSFVPNYYREERVEETQDQCPGCMICTIGKLDRVLSEMIVLSETELDLADQQTMKHHAEDLMGVGTKILKTLESKSLPVGLDYHIGSLK